MRLVPCLLGECVRRRPNLLSECPACWGSLTETFCLFIFINLIWDFSQKPPQSSEALPTRGQLHIPKPATGRAGEPDNWCWAKLTQGTHVVPEDSVYHVIFLKNNRINVFKTELYKLKIRGKIIIFLIALWNIEGFLSTVNWTGEIN